MKIGDKQFQLYIEKEYKPAQRWFSTEASKKWIAKYIPTMDEYINNSYDRMNFGVYLIAFNDVPVYVGESVKTCNRLVVHCHHLYEDPDTYFAVSKKEIEDEVIKISIKVLAENLLNDNDRKDAEKEFIRIHRPILQQMII